MTFVYFLKGKNEILSKFKEFKSLVENQTGQNRIMEVHSTSIKTWKFFSNQMDTLSTNSSLHPSAKWNCWES